MHPQDVFPYPSFRPGQLELANSVYATCKGGGRLVVEAMSGFGKTASVLTGSLLASSETGGRIIYACRTKRQVFRVLEEVQRIQRRTPLRAIYLFSKNDYCLLKERSAFPVSQESFKWYCSFNVSNNLCSYFLNLSLVNAPLTSLVDKCAKDTPLHSNLLSDCNNLHVCPYEVARLVMAEAEVIVTTYHYLFDEASKSVLLASSSCNPSNTTLIIDEAHNLREFVRDTFTSSISLQELERAYQDSHALNLDRVAASLREITDELARLASENPSWYLDKQKVGQLLARRHDETWLPNLVLELSASAKIGWESISTGRNIPTSITRAGSFFVELLSSYERDDITMAKSDHTFYLVNTQPSTSFMDATDKYRSLILLSATINPSNLFLRSIGLTDGTAIHRVNPSQTFRVRTIIDTGVSTRFKTRSFDMYSRITEKIAAICDSIEGGVGIFMPSYTILESLERIRQIMGKRNLLTESRNLNALEADHIMQSFKSTHGSVLLAVQGGKFSEGEDFPGDQMDASIVVGLSLPPPSPVMYAEYAHPNLSRHETYLVVSLLPAVRKAIQAAGRHMRSPNKKGMVFFLDSRFNDQEIIQMMPQWLRHDLVRGNFEPKQLRELTQDFWSGDEAT